MGVKIEQQTFGGFRCSHPSLSQDFSRLAYSAHVGFPPSPEILIQALMHDEPTQLTFDGVNGHEAIEPTWSPDGAMIAFTQDSGERSAICVIDIERNVIAQLTKNGGRNWSPDWSPSGREIAFVFSEASGDISHIHIIEANGTGERRLFPNQSWVASPRWSPTGRYIAYRGGVDIPLEQRTRQIYIVDLMGQEIARVTNPPLTYESPVWSPDGTEIAFAAGTDQDRNIYILRLADLRMSKLTDGPGRQGQPTWSPNATHLAFALSWNGQNHIYRIDRHGEDMLQLTDGPGSAKLPSWSPSGDQITFVENGDIYVIDTDGNQQQRLTRNGSNTRPTWSPDGNKIAYLHGGEDIPAIHVIDADGRNPTKIYENQDLQNYGLSWSSDGHKLAYIYRQNQGEAVGTQVGILDIATLTDDISALDVVFPRDVQWSPLGGQYIISASPPLDSINPSDGIYVIDRDGNDCRLLFTHQDLNGAIGGLSWRPDGQCLVFGGEDDTMFMVNVETGHRQVLMEAAHSPDWVGTWGVHPGNRLRTIWGRIKQHNRDELHP